MTYQLAFRPVILLAVMCLSALMALPTAAEEPVPKIHVTGEGVVEASPDMATVHLTVTREGDTARAALDANTAAMSKVVEGMREEGIGERDLRTSNFSIQPRYRQPPTRPGGERPPPHIVGYIVRNSLSVRVRDLDRLGAILDRSVSLGVNEGGRLVFENEDTDRLMAEARVAAVQDAIARADTLAGAAGVKRGEILDMSEQSFRPGPRPVMQAEMAMARSDDAVPLLPGENTYRASVTISFAIGD